MGRYDDITPEQLRAELLKFPGLIQRMDREATLLRSSPIILRLLGELRQMLFAFEIGGARHLGGENTTGEPGSDPAEGLTRGSLQIVREARRREKELQDEVRGWVIRWKRYTLRGTVQGYGQFYERPYAWLED